VIAARRAGQEIAKLHPHRGRPRKGKSKGLPVETILSELKISKILSHRWQRLARIPDEEFFGYLAECWEAGEEPTRQGLLRLEERLRTAGGTSEGGTPRGGHGRQSGVKARRDDERHKLFNEHVLRLLEETTLNEKDAAVHRAKLRELWAELTGTELPARLDQATLHYIEQLSRELIEYEERRSR
jgi:hypothetical protein